MTDSDRPGHAIQYLRQVDLFRKVRSCSEELVFGISILGFKISNMAASLFNRYIWLVDTIYRAGAISREEIDRRWARSQYNDLHESGIPDRRHMEHLSGRYPHCFLSRLSAEQPFRIYLQGL